MAKFAVYTASFGMRDYLHVPNGNVDSIDFICFTDDAQIWPMHCRSVEANPWQIRVVPNLWQGDPRRTAKYYKLHSHRLLPEYDATLWLDCNIQIKRISLDQFELRDDLAITKHPSRDCLYMEAARCIAGGHDHPVRIAKQIGRYGVAGIRRKSGLWRGGILWRKNTSAVTKFNNTWWSEIQEGSIRDQISLPVALQNSEVPYQTVPRDVPSLIIHRHYKRPANAKTNALQRKN